MFFLLKSFYLFSECTIISPRKNELWHINHTYEIKGLKEKCKNYQNVKIELYQENDFLALISESKENNGLFHWAIPDNLYNLNPKGLIIKLFDPFNSNFIAELEVFLILKKPEIQKRIILSVAANSLGANCSYGKTEFLLAKGTDYGFDYYLLAKI